MRNILHTAKRMSLTLSGLSATMAAVVQGATDTSTQSQSQPGTYTVQLVSHTPHLLYKLSPKQKEKCPLKTNYQVFYAPTYGEANPDKPNMLIGATVGLATPNAPVGKKELFLECTKMAWGTLDTSCVWDDLKFKDTYKKQAWNRPTAAFYPLCNLYNPSATDTTQKCVCPSRWPKEHKYPADSTVYMKALTAPQTLDDIPHWVTMIDKRKVDNTETAKFTTSDNKQVDMTLFNLAQHMRRSKWIDNGTGIRWLPIWKKRDSELTYNNIREGDKPFDEQKWKENFNEKDDRKVLNEGKAKPAGLFLLTKKPQDYGDYRATKQQPWCRIAPFLAKVEIEKERNETRDFERDNSPDSTQLRELRAWVYSDDQPAPKCHVLALCCDWTNATYRGTEDAYPINREFGAPGIDDSKLVPKPEFCRLKNRSNIEVRTKSDKVEPNIRWVGETQEVIELSESSPSMVAYRMGSTGMTLYAVVAIPSYITNVDKIRIIADSKQNAQMELEQNGLIPLPGSEDKFFTIEEKGQQETRCSYKLYLAKMKMTGTIGEYLARETYDHQWTFDFDEQKKASPTWLTIAEDTTSLDIVTVYGDSCLNQLPSVTKNVKQPGTVGSGAELTMYDATDLETSPKAMQLNYDNVLLPWVEFFQLVYADFFGEEESRAIQYEEDLLPIARAIGTHAGEKEETNERKFSYEAKETDVSALVAAGIRRNSMTKHIDNQTRTWKGDYSNEGQSSLYIPNIITDMYKGLKGRSCGYGVINDDTPVKDRPSMELLCFERALLFHAIMYLLGDDTPMVIWFSGVHLWNERSSTYYIDSSYRFGYQDLKQYEDKAIFSGAKNAEYLLDNNFFMRVAPKNFDFFSNQSSLYPSSSNSNASVLRLMVKFEKKPQDSK